jgi:hypothetical protein
MHICQNEMYELYIFFNNSIYLRICALRFYSKLKKFFNKMLDYIILEEYNGIHEYFRKSIQFY